MGHRKIINRMAKAQSRHSEAMREIAEAGAIGIVGKSIDVELHNVCVEAYNVHVSIWNQLQRYTVALKAKRPRAGRIS